MLFEVVMNPATTTKFTKKDIKKLDTFKKNTFTQDIETYENYDKMNLAKTERAIWICNNIITNNGRFTIRGVRLSKSNK